MNYRGIDIIPYNNGIVRGCIVEVGNDEIFCTSMSDACLVIDAYLDD